MYLFLFDCLENQSIILRGFTYAAGAEVLPKPPGA
jgi:hypothetical protein